MKDDDEDKRTIDELREILAKQVLLIAIDDENAQLKIDALKATEPKGRGARTPAAANAVSPMSLFHARVKQAEEGNGDGEPAETD